MRALSCLFPLILLACSASSDKDDADTGSISSPADEGAEDEDWWEEEDGEDADGEDEDGEDEWEQVDGVSMVMEDESGEEAWLFVENLTEEDRKEEGAEDSEDSEDSEDTSDPEDEWGESYVGPACIMTWASWEPVCVAFTGEAWGTGAETDPEAFCTTIDSDSEDDWYYTEDGCAADPKAYCVIDENPSTAVKSHYYNPMPLSDAEESCAEQDGTFYPLVEEEEEEEEYDMGTRWVGYVMLDNSWGFASFEHFVESGENCKANAIMYDITDVDPCDDCEFSKSFVVGEFDYEIDAGGCPSEELDEVTGMTVTFGHGRAVMFEEDGVELRSLWYRDDG